MPVKVVKRTGKRPWKIVDKKTGKVEATALTRKAAEQNARTRNKAGYGKRTRQAKGFMRLTDNTASR